MDLNFTSKDVSIDCLLKIKVWQKYFLKNEERAYQTIDLTAINKDKENPLTFIYRYALKEWTGKAYKVVKEPISIAVNYSAIENLDTNFMNFIINESMDQNAMLDFLEKMTKEENYRDNFDFNFFWDNTKDKGRLFGIIKDNCSLHCLLLKPEIIIFLEKEKLEKIFLNNKFEDLDRHTNKL